jgi:hypothetical protein
LSALPALRNLNLEGTKVTDAGLEHLKGMTSLEQLGVLGTGVTKEGEAAIRQSIKGLTIIDYSIIYDEHPRDQKDRDVEPLPTSK